MSSITDSKRDMTGEQTRKPVTQIVLLGTGTPNADPDRCGPAVAILVDGIPYLIDCGPGIVRRAAAAYKAGICGLAVENLNRLFLTHLHSDHTAGYPDLILTPWVLGRSEPLEVYGPEGTLSMTEHILAAYAQDIRVRRDGLEPSNDRGYRVKAHEIQEGACYQDANIRVEAIPVSHGAWPSFGFRFATPDKTIVLSGDTCPVDSLEEPSTGCDVLIHEVYAAERFKTRPKVWQDYHASMHTSAYELGKFAARVQPGLLILYHQLFWGASDDELLAEIRQHYDGIVVSGSDLDVY
jgi:ribonuclease BN (tRNA processing enzyme)